MVVGVSMVVVRLMAAADSMAAARLMAARLAIWAGVTSQARAIFRGLIFSELPGRTSAGMRSAAAR